MDDQKKEHTRFSISVPTPLFEEFEVLRTQLEMTRSDAIRKGMRLYMNESVERLADPQEIEVLGTISYLEKAHVHAHPHPHGTAHARPAQLDHTHEKRPHSHRGAKENRDADSYYFPKDQQEFIEINDLQHEFLQEIITTTHIHAGPEKCMIIIAVKGSLARINVLLDAMKAFKTIASLKFVALESRRYG